MAPLKVLIPVDHAVGISGPHRNVVGSLNALGSRDDVEVVLLTAMIDDTEPYARAPNIEIRLGFHPHEPRRVVTNLWRIQQAARGCDVIYVPSGLKAMLYAQSVKFRRRLVAGPNVTPLPIGKRHDSPGRIELRLMCDTWFEMSRSRRDHVIRQSGVQGITYIHHAIDRSKFSPRNKDSAIWARLGIPADEIHVLYVGRDNEPRKGVSQLLDAANALSIATDPSIRFVLAGNMSDQTKARAAHMPNVSLVGFRMGDELASLFATADISVVPSSWESFGFTVLEAMSSGTPVVASRTGGIPEIVVDGETGVLVDISNGRNHFPNAGQELADAILRLANDADLRARMGANARERVLSHFSEERLGNDLVSVFRNEPRASTP